VADLESVPGPPPSWGEPRSKTITWYDPSPGAQAALGMSGLDYLRAIAEGEYPGPPIGAHFDFVITRVEVGDVEFTATPDESAYNPIGVVHGGLVCTLLDSVLGCAVHTTLPAGVTYTSIELKVNYLRAVHAASGPLRAHGWVTRPGRRVAFADADVRDGGGRLLATASGSCLVMTP
jgi:uncharacterized protein (TIGR00369 family)